MANTHRSRRRITAAASVLAAMAALPAPAAAQLDPLLFLKGSQPNVIVMVDVANRMQRDAPTNPAQPRTTSNYYDPFVYTGSLLGATQQAELGLNSSNMTSQYRRKYVGLEYINNSNGDKFSAITIAGVGDLNSSFGSFEAPTRLAVARAALHQAIQQNQSVARFELIKMRQGNNLTPATELNSGPVLDTDTNQAIGDLGGTGKWNISRPTVTSFNGTVSSGANSILVKADAANANATIVTMLGRNPRSITVTSGVPNGLLPSGYDDANNPDQPVDLMLADAKAEAQRLITADTLCRNTVAVLIVGGGEGNTTSGASPTTTATSFKTLSSRRVPIYVIAIAPPSAEVAQLQAIAANSGGQYFEITKAMIDAAMSSSMNLSSVSAPPAGTVVVPEVVTAINTAVQHAFTSFADFNAAPTATLPFGPSTEFPTGSPIVGTVNLENARDINGVSLPDTIVFDRSNAKIPQRANVLLNSGFSLPGFDGKLRAFRTFKPVADNNQVARYKFVADGTRLWVGSVPAADSRNIYTVLPNGTMTAFTVANAATLKTYMNLTNDADVAAVINFVRSQPLGAIVNSTPAVMDPPSVDPPPDEVYPGFSAANVNRRSIIWVGANDGMLHGIDGRLGKEVWAYIPFNLLPKLKELRYGQPVGSFNYMAEGSPKIADVRVSAPCESSVTSCWRSYLFFGEGPGGTFYQTFDVTMSDMGTAVLPTSDSLTDVLAYFADPSKITFKWAFPSYTNFDYTLAPYGDIKATAPTIEKTVGQTWADPAVGQMESATGKYVFVAGSGFLPYSTEQKSNRGVAAGTTFYVLNVETGAVYDSALIGNDGIGETVDNCVLSNDCSKIKNALQADPVATGPPNSRYITMSYVGDLDGRVWRFDLGTNTTTSLPYIETKPPVKLWDGGAAHPVFSSMATVNVGTTQQYIFFGTGSDLLASNSINQQYKLIGVLDNVSSGTETFSKLLTAVDGVGADEKVTAFPAVAGDIVFFTTTTFNPSTPCTLPSAKLYALTFIGGPAYDTTGDARITTADNILVTTIANTRATAPFVGDRHLIFGTGADTQIFGDPESYDNGVGQAGVRILSWRELR